MTRGAPAENLMRGLQIMMSDDTCEVIRALRPKTYIHDICIRCGKLVDRNTEGRTG